MNLSNRTIICCYEMLHVYLILLLHLQIAKNKGFLIKRQVFTGFSAKLKVLKDFNKIKGFKGSLRGPASDFSLIVRRTSLSNGIAVFMPYSIIFNGYFFFIKNVFSSFIRV